MLSLSPPLGRAWIEARLPHAGSMCLLDEIGGWDEDSIRCSTSTHLAAANPLRAGGRLGAASAIEYAAQAMALHAAIRQGPGGARLGGGMLASVRDLRLFVERLDHLAVTLYVECRHRESSAMGMRYDFRLQAADTVVATGLAMISLRPAGAGA